MWHIEAVKSSKNVVRMGVCYYCGDKANINYLALTKNHSHIHFQ